MKNITLNAFNDEIEKIAALSTKQKAILAGIAIAGTLAVGATGGVIASNLKSISDMDKWRAQRSIDRNTAAMRTMMESDRKKKSLSERTSDLVRKVDPFYDI